MISFLKNKTWFKGKRVCGIHVQVESSTTQFASCLIEQSKHSAIVKNQHHGLLKELAFDFDETNIPFHLSVDGKGILHIQKETEENSITAINRILPQSKIKEFHIQEYTSGQKNWVSLIRKDKLDEILLQFQERGIHIISFVLGAFQLDQLHLISDINSTLTYQLDDRLWSFNHGGLNKILKQKENLKHPARRIDESTTLEEKYLLPFMNGLVFFGLENQSDDKLPKEVILNKDTFFQKRLFKLAGVSLLLFFFSILLINFLVFDHYRTQSQQLESQANAKKELLNRLDFLQNELALKKKFFRESGLINPAKLSFKADRLVSEVPESAILSGLVINPIQKKDYKQNETPKFQLNEVRLEGSIKQSTDLNEWIKVLKTKEWIKEVSIDSYHYSKKEKTGFFNLLILTN